MSLERILLEGNRGLDWSLFIIVVHLSVVLRGQRGRVTLRCDLSSQSLAGTVRHFHLEGHKIGEG